MGDGDELVEAMLPTAAALTCAVADRDPVEVEELLAELDTRDLHALLVLLAAHVDPDKPFSPNLTGSPIAQAVRLAAMRFRVPESRVLDRSRDQAATNARAVACYVARLAGMSSPAVGKHIGRDHSTVLNACARVGESAHLRQIAMEILEELGLQSPRQREAMAS